MFKQFRDLILGAPRDPMDKRTRHSIALTAFLAWVGLGADGLSSTCYGPQEAFLALGRHPQLALYLAIATALTVFIISFAYNQVIELFPTGGGGYKVATKLLGANMGVIAGAALIVDYILTIAISIASGTDAFFSLLPVGWQGFKVHFEVFFIVVLIMLNLRGMKESIKILMPIFVGFVVTHLFMITYGIGAHGKMVPVLFDNAVQETSKLALTQGGIFVAALFLHAYSIGGGTYTGLEAVSNNVNTLAKPRVRTGKWTMFYMAVSLSFTAAGIMLLYLLWDVRAIPGQTLNAVAFRHILGSWHYAHPMLVITLLFEFGLLFVGANTGFLGGPAVLANMAMDEWVPRRFRNLSNRLVTQNGVILFGLAAILILVATQGHVGFLIILYSVNVFLAFMVSIFGLCSHWWKQRRKQKWLWNFVLSFIGFVICAGILCVIVFSRFLDGGIEAIGITGLVILACAFVRQHYRKVNKKLKNIDKLFTEKVTDQIQLSSTMKLDPSKQTAIFLVGKSRGAGMHTVLWAQRLFPDLFHNFIFIGAGVVDVESYGAERALNKMKKETEKKLSYFANFAHKQKIPYECHIVYGTDPVEKITELANELQQRFAHSVFFASQLVPSKDTWWNRFLHNETAFSIQRRLYLQGMQMVILPMKLE